VRTDERGDSEVVGMVLLIAVVVIGVTLLTASALFVVPTEDEPQTDVAANVTETRVHVNHTGGEVVDADELSVVVRDGDDEFRGDGIDGVGDQFEPGEGWSADHTTDLSVDDGDQVRVLVVHDNRTLLLDSRRRVYPG